MTLDECIKAAEQRAVKWPSQIGGVFTFKCTRCHKIAYFLGSTCLSKFQGHCSRKCAGFTYSRERHHNWKGGRNRSKDGYVYEHVRGAGYFLKHRLVMEKHLGRKLKSFENVHHKNGLRHDNRIENLELWTVQQPYGQRVDDLIDWMIANYGEEINRRMAVNELLSLHVSENVRRT